MNRCKDCKHYRPKEGVHLGQCFRWHGGNGSFGYSWEAKDIGINEVIVETDEGWGAMMGPEFGCVLWEGRS